MHEARRRKFRRVGIVALVSSVTLTGCAPDITVKVKSPAELARPALALPPDAKLAPVALTKVAINIARGTKIGERLFTRGSSVCRIGLEAIYWNSGRLKLDGQEFSDRFHASLHAAKYNVAGDPRSLFDDPRRTVSPRYRVGARIDDITLLICRPMERSHRQSGSASVRVAWQVQDPLSERLIYETTTEGAAAVSPENPLPDGDIALILEAFGQAARNLAADRGFYDLLSRAGSVPAEIHAVTGATIRFATLSPSRSPIVERMDYIRLGVVTLSAGDSHGSGFFISPQLILTNHHVVRGRDVLRVTLTTGRSVLGEVIRTHPQRDVALVSVEAGSHSPLPLRLDVPARVGEEVYAVGTPLDRRLSATVSKGIVSAFRSNPAGLEDIQADVDIHGGNSGGPLLDAAGNVVGIAYAGLGMRSDKTSAGLNLFIPIRDAIGKLGLSPDDPQTRRPSAAR